MVKLPRAEQRSIYTPADMPHLAGDGWTAPGRALQGLGKAIGGLGAALGDAEDHVDPRQLQEAKLAQLQFINDFNKEELDFRATYAGDGKEYGATRTELFNQKSQEFLNRWPDPIRRRLEINQERFRGSVQQDTYGFGYTRYNDTLYSNTGRAITGETGRFSSYVEDEERLNGYRENPEQFSADLDAHIQSIDAIIDGLPLDESKKDQLRNDAAQQLEDTLSKLPAGVTLGTARQQIERFSAPRAGQPVIDGQESGGTLTPPVEQEGKAPGQPAPSLRTGSAGQYLRSRLAKGYEKRISDVENLHPVMQDRLAAFLAAAEDAGHDIRVLSGHRSQERQKVLWDRAVKKYGSPAAARRYVAPPGGSTHQSGEAVDLQYGDRKPGLGGTTTAAVKWAHENAAKFGLSFPLGHEDWHLEPVEARQGGRRFGGQYRQGPSMWRPQQQTQQAASSQGVRVNLSAYSPQAGGSRMEGDYRAARPGPDGQAIVRTLADVAAGTSEYVTIAGNPRDYGKTFTIPEISFVDRAGKTQTLRNVKAVVHDTGAAFRNAPEGRFDVPIDRDASDKQMAASHGLWKKAGIQFLPDGGQTTASLPMQDRSLVRVAGLKPPANDAAPPEAEGSTGGGTIQTSSGEVRVAAEGQQPGGAQAFRGSVANHLAERLIKRLPALEQKHRAEVAAQVKSVADRAARGEIIPPDEETAIRAELGRLNDDQITTAFEMALAAARTTAQFKQLPPAALETMILQGRAVANREGTSAAMSAQLKAMEALKDTMFRELKANSLAWAVEANVLPELPPLVFTPEGLGARALAAATVANHYGPEYYMAFMPEEREALAARLNQGGPEAALMLTAITQAFEQDTPRVMAEFTKDAPEAALLGWLTYAGGDSATIKDATDALALKRSEGFKSIAPGANVARATAIDALGGAFQHMPKNEQYAMDLANLLYEVRARRAGAAEFDADLWKQGLNEALGANTDPATGITYGGIAYNNPNWFFSGGSDPFIVPANVDAGRVHELLDAIRITDLVEGGMPGTFADIAGADFGAAADVPLGNIETGLVAETPPAASEPDSAPSTADVDPAATAAALGVQRLANIPALTALQQKGLPVDDSGRPVKLSELRRARLITVGDGRYFLAMGDNDDPRYIRTPTGENYVLDLKALEPVLSDRRPDLYRWR